MSDLPDRYIPGKTPILASDLNAIVEQVKRALNITGADVIVDSTGVHFLQRPGGRSAPTTVKVRNDSGEARSSNHILTISGAVTPPTDAAGIAAFKKDPVLIGVEPEAANLFEFVVLAEDIADGAIGRAYAVGQAVAQVSISDTTHQYAVAATGNTTNLVSHATQGARIVYQPSGTGLKWCLILLPAGDGIGAGVLPVPTALYQVVACVSFTSTSDYTLSFDYPRARP